MSYTINNIKVSTNQALRLIKSATVIAHALLDNDASELDAESIDNFKRTLNACANINSAQVKKELSLGHVATLAHNLQADSTAKLADSIVEYNQERNLCLAQSFAKAGAEVKGHNATKKVCAMFLQAWQDVKELRDELKADSKEVAEVIG